MARRAAVCDWHMSSWLSGGKKASCATHMGEITPGKVHFWLAHGLLPKYSALAIDGFADRAQSFQVLNNIISRAL